MSGGYSALSMEEESDPFLDVDNKEENLAFRGMMLLLEAHAFMNGGNTFLSVLPPQ